MSEGVDPLKVAGLLRRLVKLQLKSSDDPNGERKVDQVFQFAMRILGSRISSTIAGDEFQSSNLIVKKLIKDNKRDKAQQFEELLGKLRTPPHAGGGLRHKWALLHLLYSLSDHQEPSSTALLSAFSSMGLRTIPTPTPTPAPTSGTATPASAGSTINGFDTLPLKPAQPHPRPVKERLAESLGFELSEDVLLRDVVFMFQGIDGKYIKYNAKEEKFLIPSTVGVSRANRDLIGRLSELGWLFKHVRHFVEISLRPDAPDAGMLQRRPTVTLPTPTHAASASLVGCCGLVGQSLCAAVEQELNDYVRLIAVLESQLKTSELQQVGSTQRAASGLTLRRLVVWMHEPLQRMKMLAMMTDNVQGQKGGQLASTVRSFTHHGAPSVRSFVDHMLNRVCKPLFSMIRGWVSDGEIHDPNAEFFVAVDQSVPMERMWFDRYTLRRDMVPSFIGLPLANKILLIGKSIIFLRACCKDTELVLDASNNAAVSSLDYAQVERLEPAIDAIAGVVNKHLLQTLLERYKLFEHFTALKQYLLLGQGDFIQYLMDIIGPDLAKPANTLFRHNLIGILEQAVQGSNAQYDPAYIVDRLDIRLLEPRQGAAECGWDLFSLDYHVDVPISTVFSPEVMGTYLRIFNSLWGIKRVEHSLSTSWRKHMTAVRFVRIVKEAAGDMYRCYALRNEMLHFVYNLQYYIMFEVLEGSWEDLVSEIKQSSDLDQLIAAHQKYLSTIVSKSMLFSDSLVSLLSSLLDTIIRFCRIQETIYNFLLEESSQRSRVLASNYEKRLGKRFLGDSASSGGSDATDSEASESTDARRGRVQLPADVKAQLARVASEYDVAFKALRRALTEHKDDTMRFLAFRLDSNDFYERKDRRARVSLSVPSPFSAEGL